jgi:hypothetical protein
MRISRLAMRALSAVAVAALLAACSGGESQSSYAPTGVLRMAARQAPFVPDREFPGYTGVRAPELRPDHHKSWVSPDVKRASKLLFVSDYAVGDVYIYKMPDVTLKGTLTGFSGPQGECSDARGNIWITNTNTSQVLQYSRAGTLLKTISDPDYYPDGCAVNNGNGDVAVSNFEDRSGGPGNVSVFHNGSGSPIVLTNPSQYYYFFPAYDISGNLYVDGVDASEISILSECPVGSSKCTSLTVSGASLSDLPGGLNWDTLNNELVIGDQLCGDQFASCLYEATISGSTARVTGTTPLRNYDGSNCDAVQGALAPRDLYFAGGCISYGSSMNSADRWDYPVGGAPPWYATGLSYPIGAAISDKKH